MPELSGNAFFATPQGWILIVVGGDGDSASPRETYLLHPQSKSRVQLPVLEDELPKRGRCLLSDCDAGAPGCGVLVFDLESPAMWFCRVSGPSNSKWSKHVYDIGTYDLPEEYCPDPKRRNMFDVAAVGGRFFFFESDSSSELGTLDFASDGGGEGPQLGAIAVPSLDDDLYGDRQRSCVVASYLLESCGGLFLASIAFYDFCFDRPGTVRVYRMDRFLGTGVTQDRRHLLGRRARRATAV